MILLLLNGHASAAAPSASAVGAVFAPTAPRVVEDDAAELVLLTLLLV